jgi:putative hydrolase
MNNNIQIMVNGKKYRITSDLHTHTVWSHGKGTIEDNVKAAIECGLKSIAIADHGPGHLTYGIKHRDIPKMRREIERLRIRYPEIEILLSVEANITGSSGRLDISPADFSKFDFVIAGYHYGAFGRNPAAGLTSTVRNFASNKTHLASKHQIAANTRSIVAALEKNDIKILTHPGDKAPVDLLEVAVTCARAGTLLELNTWHECLTPEDLRTMSLADVYFVISSDAHTPGRVGDFASALSLAIAADIDLARIINLEAV